MEKITIAVSGDEGSLSEEAALAYAEKKRIEPKILYSIDVEGVLNALDNHRADLGIFPIVNSRGGVIHSSVEAMGRHNYKFLEDFYQDFKMSLMVKKNKTREDIRKIASHPQAITQCDNYIKREFKNVRLIYWDDTAKAARDLSENVLSDDTAVIAPARCAVQYGLELIEKGIQDSSSSSLTFLVVKK
jgi:prephenate dehydratase